MSSEETIYNVIKAHGINLPPLYSGGSAGPRKPLDDSFDPDAVNPPTPSLPNFTPYANLLSCIFSTFSTPPPLPSHFSLQEGGPASSSSQTNSLSLPPNASVNVNTSPSSTSTNYVSLILCTADVFLLLPADFQRRFLDVIDCILSGGGDAGYKSGRTQTWSHHSEVLYSVVRFQYVLPRIFARRRDSVRCNTHSSRGR